MDADDDVAYYLAEWYRSELTDKSVDDIVAKLDVAAITVSDEGTPVRLVVTFAVPTDEVLYGVFGAQSPDIVTATCARWRPTSATVCPCRHADKGTSTLRNSGDGATPTTAEPTRA
jgi:hypothetical protein